MEEFDRENGVLDDQNRQLQNSIQALRLDQEGKSSQVGFFILFMQPFFFKQLNISLFSLPIFLSSFLLQQVQAEYEELKEKFAELQRSNRDLQSKHASSEKALASANGLHEQQVSLLVFSCL